MVREAIILVAGMGTRLKPLTLQNHKCLTEVNGTPILENTLKILEAVGCRRVILVVGYLKQQIMSKIGSLFGSMQIEYAENDVFSSTNTSFSLNLGLEKSGIYDELLILEGDVFFEKKILTRLLQDEKSNVTVLEKYNPNLDGTFAEVNMDSFVVDWVHKSQRPDHYVLEDKFKTVNIHKFGYEFVNHTLKEYLKQSLCQFHGKEPLENVMMRIVRNYPCAIKGLILDGEKWFEIDDAHDLKIAEEIFKAHNELV